MKIAIYGCGAIGLDMAVHLIRFGHDVTLIARTRTAETLRRHGIRHSDYSGKQICIQSSQYRVVDSTRQANTQDIVFLTVSADVLMDISESLPALLHQSTWIVSATNGIPPWYSYLQDHTIGKYLPNTEIRDRFLGFVPAEMLIGCVIERSVTRTSPNEVIHTFGKGYVIGELNQQKSQRLHDLSKMLESAGLSARLSIQIHKDIWLKLLGNICLSPMSVILERNIGGMLSDVVAKSEMVSITREAETVGIKLGVINPGDFDMDKFLTFAMTNLSGHEPSMLQGFRRGSDLEIHRIIEVVIMLGDLTSVDVSHLRAVHSRLKQKLAQRG